MADLVSQVKGLDNVTYDLQDKVSIFGGRNLALGTASLQSITKSSSSGSAKVIKRYSLSDYAIASLNSTSLLYISFDARVSSGQHRVHPYAGIIENGSAITKSSVSGAHYATTDWTYISVPMTLTDTPTWVQVTANTDSESGGITYELKNLKLEIGNKATDWTPAPEDLAVYIDDETIEFFQ